MRRRWPWALLVFWCSAAFAVPTFEGLNSTIKFQATASAIAQSGSWAGEFGGSFLTAPLSEKNFLIGPRFSVVSAANSLDLALGGESTLWLMNSFGPGLAGDIIAYSRESAVPRERFEAFVAMRVSHFLSEGAWAIRAGTLYDSATLWNVKLGITLQFSGVPNLAAI